MNSDMNSDMNGDMNSDMNSNINNINNINNIKFVKQDDELTYKPLKFTDTYYQFCQFKHPYSELYGSRKVIFNEQGKILKVFEKEYKSGEIKKFIKCHPINKYKMFPIYDIKLAELPNSCDLLGACSKLINNNVKVSNYLEF